jgi:hypothetical protein
MTSSKIKGSPTKPSAVKSNKAHSSTKMPVLKKNKAKNQSEDPDYVGEDPSNINN